MNTDYYCPICHKSYQSRRRFLKHLKTNKDLHELLINLLLQVGLTKEEREYLGEEYDN